MIKKIEIFLFILFLFMQNFALIKTSSFGVAALTVFLIYLTIKYGFYLKINLQFLICSIVLISLSLVSSQINQFYNISQIIRLVMVIFIVWSANKYVYKIYSMNCLEQFWKYFYFIAFITCLYGIYQYLASLHGLPLFLNIFNNNPSYMPKTVYDYYGGWTDSNSRVYGIFSEPSFYALFLVYCFLMLFFKPYNKIKTIILSLLILINIFLTYARSGWAILFYCIGIMIAFFIFKRATIIRKIISLIFIFIPFINLSIMYKLQQNTFTDLSSYGRTFSAIYYLKNSYDTVTHFLFGHGLGFISAQTADKYLQMYVENYSHNGYVEILYSLGIPILVSTIIILYKNINKIKVYKYRIITFAAIFTVCSFGASYNIESIIAIITIIFTISKIKSRNVKDLDYGKHKKLKFVCK
ncbi:O-antigen ligase family protein [Clostridium tyrobutyricum]|uniref:O-antigen ligase family protein n=1 Tax=Clostridium tyrobutyricum TaxID=1519 RepID=UPI001C387987